MVRVAGERLTVQPETASLEVFSRVTPADPLPVVGDWVALDVTRAIVRHVLPRATCFRRKIAGRRSETQAVAANVDIAFLVTALVGDERVGPRSRASRGDRASDPRARRGLSVAVLYADESFLARSPKG